MIPRGRRTFFSVGEAGLVISALEWGGSGPLAILHHANGFCGALWGPVAEKLRDRYHVVALDARGHGDSSKPKEASAYRWECFAEDLLDLSSQLLAATGQQAVEIVVGHSFGGSAAIVAAARRPEFFRRMVLVDPVVPPPPDLRGQVDGKQAPMILAANARKRRRLWPSRSEAKEAWLRRSFFSSWDERVLDLYLREGMRERPDGRVELKCPPEVEAMIFEGSLELDLYACAEQVSVPALIIHASLGSFPREFHEALAGALAGAAVEEVSASHLLPMEAPELVAEAVLRFAGQGELRTR